MSSSIQTKVLVNEPPNTALKQQRMKAWNPILDPLYVILSLFAVGAGFIPIGFALIRTSNNVVEIIKTYDSFHADRIDSSGCSIEGFNENKGCTIEFEIDKDMEGPILLYYGVENFYQNHREYTTSRDDAQVSNLLFETFNSIGCDQLLFSRIDTNSTSYWFIAYYFFKKVIGCRNSDITFRKGL